MNVGQSYFVKGSFLTIKETVTCQRAGCVCSAAGFLHNDRSQFNFHQEQIMTCSEITWRQSLSVPPHFVFTDYFPLLGETILS